MLISKGTGKFYNVYEDDAFIISFIMDYKVLPGIKCGFPDNALSKVIKNSYDNHISYKVVVNKTVTDEYNYKNLNQYDKYVILSRKTAMLNDRLETLIKKIKKADRATLEKIIEKLAMFKIISNDFNILNKYKVFIIELDNLIENIPRRDFFIKIK